jgi:hypothetical protein
MSAANRGGFRHHATINLRFACGSGQATIYAGYGLISKNKQSSNVGMVFFLKKRTHSVYHHIERVIWFCLLIMLQLQRNHQKQIIGLRTNMTFPQIQQIHIIHNRFTPLNLKQDTDFTYFKIIIWPQTPRCILPKQAFFSLRKPSSCASSKKTFCTAELLLPG